MTHGSEWITTREASNRIGFGSTWTVNQACKHGKLVCKRTGSERNGRLYVLTESIERITNLFEWKQQVNNLARRGVTPEPETVFVPNVDGHVNVLAFNVAVERILIRLNGIEQKLDAIMRDFGVNSVAVSTQQPSLPLGDEDKG